MNPGEMPVVAYILCPGHSGSTLLDHLIGSHSQAVSGGELKALRARWGRRSRRSRKILGRCTCGVKPALRCPFWVAVDAELRSAGLALETLRLNTHDDAAFAAQNLALFRAMARVSGRRLVVDSSKSTGRFARLRRLEALDVRPIRLVRDPRGVVLSRMRKGDHWVAAAVWYAILTRRARSVLSGLAPRVVRYEDLAAKPRETLSGVMAWLGLEFEDSQLAWRGHEHHSFAGNHTRRSPSSAIALDDRWTRELSALQKAGVLWLTGPSGWREEATRATLPSRGEA